MKTIKEVAEELGITRRTLQEYDRVGLLSPSNKAEVDAGKLVQWKYDDEAIQKLRLILLFVEAGYKRNDIKEILADGKNFNKNFKKLIREIEKKKRRIDSLLAEVKASDIVMELPDNILEPLIERSQQKIDQGIIDVEKAKQAMQEYGDLDDPDVREKLKLQTVIEGLAFFDEDPTSYTVQSYVFKMLYYFVRFCAKYSDEDYTPEELTEEIDSNIKDKEFRGWFVDSILDFFSEIWDQIDEAYGEGKKQYMMDALEFFRNKLIVKRKKK